MKGIRKILDSSIRDPGTREGTLAKCSGLASGELSCKLCYRENNQTASQIFWQHDVKFTLPPAILEKKQSLTVPVDSDENDEGEKIGFVQHLSSTKRSFININYVTFIISPTPRLLPFERYSQLCKMSCCLEDNARLFPNFRKFV